MTSKPYSSYARTAQDLVREREIKEEARWESLVSAQECLIVKEVMNTCLKHEGVNAAQTCMELVRRFRECSRDDALVDYRKEVEDKMVKWRGRW